MNHWDLCNNFANFKNTIYIEVPLGSIWGGQYAKNRRRNELFQEWKASEKNWDEKEIEKQLRQEMIGTQIADVIKILPSYTRFIIDIFEIKKSRSDFLSDIRREKWKGYLQYCNRFYFACESGLCKKEEIPDGVGLYIKGNKGWVCIKKAKKREIEYSYDMLLAMLFYRQKEDRSELRRCNIASHYNIVKELKKTSKKVAMGFRLMTKTECEIKNLIYQIVDKTINSDEEGYFDKQQNLYNKLREKAKKISEDLLK